MKLHKLNNKRVFISRDIINIAAYSKNEPRVILNVGQDQMSSGVVGDVHAGLFSLFDIFSPLREQIIIEAYRRTNSYELPM